MADDQFPDSPRVTRRQVMKALAATAVCPMVTGCEFADVDRDDIEVDESSFSIDDTGYEELAEVGGTACHDHGSQETLLVRVSDDQIAAFDRTCPHDQLDMGHCDSSRPAEWDDDQQVLICKWHDSAFEIDGTYRDDLPNEHSDEVPDIQTYPVDFDPETGTGTVFSE